VLFGWRATPHLGLRVAGDALVPLLRDRFFVEGLDTIHTPSPVGAQVSFGVESQFP
jgi:hypothetical protein